MAGVAHRRTAQRGRCAAPLDVASALAAQQYGVVTRGQLVEGGMSGSAIDRRVADGGLVRIHGGVFAVGHAVLRRQGFWMAAVLACGEGSVLSHRTAAAACGLREGDPAKPDVTLAGSRGRRKPGIVAHTGRLAANDVTDVEGIPVTTVARTLLDLAEVVRIRELRRAVIRAEELRIFDLRAVDEVLARANGRRGTKALLAVLDDLVGRPGGSKEELEALALDLIRASGLPLPAVNTLVGDYEADLLWRDQRLVVELDSWKHHGTRAGFERDRRRDADLQLAGYRVLRLTWRQITREPDWAVARIRAFLGT
jgi:predicted transcriptional regulator of viral defense system